MKLDRKLRMLNYIAMFGWTWLGYLYGLSELWQMLLVISVLHLAFQLALIIIVSYKEEKVTQ